MKILNEIKKISLLRVILTLIFLVLTVVWCRTIYGFSDNDAKKSSAQSEKVTEVVVQVTKPDYNKLPEPEKKQVVDKTETYVRKFAHFFSFMLLGFLTYFCVGFIRWLPKKILLPVLVCLPFCVLFAISDEYHQTFVDGRAGRVLDVGIDSCGAVCGIICAIILVLIIRFVRHLAKKNKAAQ